MASVDKIVEVFRACAKTPSITRATITNTCFGLLNIVVEWVQRDLELFENTKSLSTFLIATDTLEAVDCGPAVAISSECLSSYNGFCRAVVRKCVTAKGDEKQMLEVWKNCRKVINIDVLAKDCHGRIYDDDQFGCLRWSSNGNFIAYIAEKKRPKAESFFKTSSSNVGDGEDTKRTETIAQGEEFEYHEDWGEKLTGKCCPIPCILNTNTGEINPVKNLPEDISFGQAVWTPDNKGLIVVGWWHTPRRLGLTFCTNRRSALFHVKFESSTCELIESVGSDNSVRSLRFSPDGKRLVYLSNVVGGPHHRGSQLMLMNWPEQTIEVIVDLVQHDIDNNFPGLYLMNFPEQIWLNDNKTIVFHSNWRSTTELLKIDTDTKEVVRISLDDAVGAWNVLDVWNDYVIVSCSSPNMKEHLRVGKLNSDSVSEVQWHNISNAAEEKGIKWKLLSLTLPESMINKAYPADRIELILVEPEREKHEKESPLIFFPHGGPHSVHTANYRVPIATFVELGYAIAMLNFRGSAGYGEINLNSLPGNVGSQDVADCKYVLDYLLTHEGYDKTKFLAYGGSHGGFLVTHLIGQFPDFFKACVCRNPVTQITSMVDISDIPDWSWVESGIDYEFSHQAEPSVLKSMWEKSPMRYVHQVKTPTLMLMGKFDVRVPSSQSVLFYKALKGRNNKMNVYNDGHSLAKTEVEADAFVNTVLWFEKHL